MLSRGARWVGRVVNAVFPVLLGLFQVAVVVDLTGPGLIRWLGILSSLPACLVLYRRRDYPQQVMVVAAVMSLGPQLTAPEGLFPYAALVALWTLTTRVPVTRSLPALLAVIGLTLLALGRAVNQPGDVAFAVLVACVIWALAWAFRSRRTAIEQAVARAAVEEQARLAREIHDVIAHSVSVIVVQAAAADDIFDTRPDRARQALRSIESTGRDALAELRQLLAAPPTPPAHPNSVRDPAVPPRAVSPDPLAPASAWNSPEPFERDNRLSPIHPDQTPTLARIRPDVIGPLERAGLQTELTVVGDVAGISPGVQLSAFRIIQESLTNVLRHGRGAGARVRVRVGGELVEVLIENDLPDPGAGRGPALAGAGRGITGMRERAALVGGEFEAGPWAGVAGRSGFRVVARLPVRSAVAL